MLASATDSHRAGGDIFDNVAALRMPLGPVKAISVRRDHQVITVGKPPAQAFFRAQAVELKDWTFPVIVDKSANGGKAFYMIGPKMREALSRNADAALVHLIPCVTKAETPFLWAVTVPAMAGGNAAWYEGSIAAFGLAREKWIRLSWNPQSGAYDPLIAEESSSLPRFPEWDQSEWLRRAFRDRLINGDDHPILKKLRGAV
jgi:hypothetical protein